MDWTDTQSPRRSSPGQGTHLLGEWYDCDFTEASLHNATTLRDICMLLTADAGLQIVGDAFHQFEPQGVTGTVLLAESHLAIHTWPQEKFVTVDIYVCNYLEDNTHKALKLYSSLNAYFQPVRETFSRVPRGRQYA
jgi:S-adenosylmethionine decarboxylase proenzyme